MENILQQLADYARYRTEEEKKSIPLVEVRRQAEEMDPNTGFPFEKAIGEQGMSMICEVKRASPSKGLIAPDFPYREIALDYEEAGASAISCLTEPRWFLGNDQYLSDISGQVRIPVLRKDFTVDPYMIFRAKILGASAVLLICAILETEQIRSYIQVADSLGLSALVEAHAPEAGSERCAVCFGERDQDSGGYCPALPKRDGCGPDRRDIDEKCRQKGSASETEKPLPDRK